MADSKSNGRPAAPARAAEPRAPQGTQEPQALQEPQEPQEPQVIATSRPFLRSLDTVPDGAAVRAAAQRLWDACRSLKLAISSYTTALLYLQRFLALTSARDADMPVLATACLVAALKTEGSPKKLESVDQAMQISSTARTYELERQVMETNAFDFRLAHAHHYVVKISKTLGLAEALARGAWAVATDAYETVAVLQYPAHTVALASICVLARFRGEKLLIRDTRQLGSRADAVKGAMRTLFKFYADRTAAGEATRAGVEMGAREYDEWVAREKLAPSPRLPPAPVLDGHEISLHGVARYRLKMPR